MAPWPRRLDVLLTQGATEPGYNKAMNDANARVVVVGSANMDCATTVARLPRMGETLGGSDFRLSPGGKGLNQAVAAARAGARTAFIARLGDDEFGGQLLEFLGRENIDLSAAVVVDGAATGAAFVAVCEGDNAIIVSPGANRLLGPEHAASADLRAGDVLLAQMETPAETVAAFMGQAKKRAARTLLNPAPAVEAATAAFAVADIILVNATALGFFCAPPGDLVARARRLLARDGQTVIVTLGADGLLCVTRAHDFRLAAVAVAAVDSTGAGDCFAGVLAARLAGGDGLREAATIAARAAAICVTRPGAAESMPRAAEFG